MRPRAGTILLAASLVLAGCTASSPQSRPYETPLNGTEVDATHEDVLQGAGNFTFREHHVLLVDNRTLPRNETARVDVDAGVAVQNVSHTDGDSSIYLVEEGQSYQRRRADGTVRYYRIDVSANLHRFARLDVARVTSKLDFAPNGITTLDGERVYVYAARENRSDEFLSSGGTVNVSVRLYVRADGLVKRLASRLTVVEGTKPHTIVITRSYSRVGSTTVTEPAWVDDARANATG